MKKNNFVYGLEIHVQLNTKAKLFSRSRNSMDDIDNLNVSLFDIGMTGTFPIVNIVAVQKAIKACFLMQSNISDTLTFDRKHYRYFDLPSSYQITQFHNPIGLGGNYRICDDKYISIKDIHIECDAAKLKEYNNKIIIDYNRCCVPLIEIVTNPCFNKIEEIELFLNLLVQDLRLNNISEARFEMSQIRVDVNMSIFNPESKTYSNRLEIKNLNSFRSIKKSILLSQKLLIEEKVKEDYTIHYDDINQNISLARKKEKALDYMYYHDSALPQINTKNIINKTESTIYKTIELVDKINNLTTGLLDNGKINLIISSYAIQNVINKYIDMYMESNYIQAINLILELKDLIICNEELNNLHLLSSVINLCAKKKILKLNLSNIAQLILDNKITDTNNLNKYLKDNKLIIDNEIEISESEVLDLIQEVDNTLISRLKDDKKVINYVVGIVMKKHKNCNPKYVYNLIMSIVNKNIN